MCRLLLRSSELKIREDTARVRMSGVVKSGRVFSLCITRLEKSRLFSLFGNKRRVIPFTFEVTWVLATPV